LFTESEIPRDENGELGESDSLLVEGTAANGNVFHAIQLFKDTEDEATKGLLNKPMPKDFVDRFHLSEVSNKSFPYSEANNFYVPLDEVYQNARGIGVVEFSPDDDGVFRHTRLLRNYKKSIFPVLSIAALRHYFQPERIQFVEKSLIMDDIKIPLQSDGRYLIKMKKKFNNFSMGGVFDTIDKIECANIS
jgi:adenylate cyclase